ncbi:hypothetical protein ABT158_46895 [Nonomuraea sp. NPDC001636]|uniref:hypothetical protein n=1 Tax=Nonomuraea sp. NPDC001636 TaxID=3154391 RepID=UPI00331DB229
MAAERAARTRAAGRRACRYCGGALPSGKRADALDCSPDRRTRYHRERLADQVRELRDRLAAVQAAAGLALPDLADLGEGMHGGTLPVAWQPDGAVVLHHQDPQIRLGDGEHAPAHCRALAAALPALASPRS